MFRSTFIPLFCTALAAGAQHPVQLALEPWANNLGQITHVANCGDDRLFALSQYGAIFIVTDSMEVAVTPFLNIETQVVNDGERGMVGLAFDPNYAENGYFYVQYMHVGGPYGISTLSRFTVSEDPDIADPTSEVVLYSHPQPSAIHQGGALEFGPDGALYVALGDGGWGGDPNNKAQRLDTPLGKVLRILPEADGTYSIPTDNPFATATGDTLPEIFAYGLRNPFRMSFDQATGDLWIGDVGQERWEEIDRWPAGSTGAPNFGWRCYEGNEEFNVSSCDPGGTYVAPLVTLAHPVTGGNACAVIGGRVYHGARYPHLQGRYIFTDLCSGKFEMLWPDAEGGWNREVGLTIPSGGFTSIGEGADGEIYVTNLFQNRLYHLVDRCPMDPPVITVAEGGLMSSAADAYQWISGNDTIAGANEQNYQPTMAGWYAVITTFTNGCTLLSDSVHYLPTTVLTTNAGNVQVYPQPADDQLVLEGGITGTPQVLLLDLQGRVLHRSRWAPGARTHRIDVSGIGAGASVLELRGAKGVVLLRRTIAVLH
ncbi:MAG: PQQ-dependent sugar dehydrogenase [Flavobacteriales bacterium]